MPPPAIREKRDPLRPTSATALRWAVGADSERLIARPRPRRSLSSPRRWTRCARAGPYTVSDRPGCIPAETDLTRPDRTGAVGNAIRHPIGLPGLGIVNHHVAVPQRRDGIHGAPAPVVDERLEQLIQPYRIAGKRVGGHER